MSEKNIWVDATSYCRDDTERKKKSWSINGNRLRIFITCAHINCPGEWIMHCHPWFDTFELHVESVDDAKKKAISLVDNVICQATDDLGRFSAK